MDDLIISMASKNNLDPKLVWAIAKQESNFNPKAMRFERNWQYQTMVAISSQNLKISYDTEMTLQSFSYGLLQQMGSTTREFGFTGMLTDLLDAETGLHWACLKLAKVCGKFKEIENIAAAWNGGHPKKNLSGQFFNQAYVNQVLKNYNDCSLKS